MAIRYQYTPEIVLTQKNNKVRHDVHVWRVCVHNQGVMYTPCDGLLVRVECHSFGRIGAGARWDRFYWARLPQIYDVEKSDEGIHMVASKRDTAGFELSRYCGESLYLARRRSIETPFGVEWFLEPVWYIQPVPFTRFYDLTCDEFIALKETIGMALTSGFGPHGEVSNREKLETWMVGENMPE